jgi:uncharacterized protein YjbJ (UPF0337 family)
MENSNSNSTVYWLLGSAVVLAGAGFVYYKFGADTPAPTPPVTDGAGTTTTGTGATAGAGAAATTGAPAPPQNKVVDYTGLPDSSTVYPNQPKVANGLTLGSAVTVRAGAEVERLDQALVSKGWTKLTSDTALGKVWKHSGDVTANNLTKRNAIVRAQDSFNYPFYRVKYSDINKQGGAVDKAVGQIKSTAGDVYGWFKDKLSDDGFVPDHLNATAVPARLRKNILNDTYVLIDSRKQSMGNKLSADGFGVNS